jgi:hypothetical protein
MTGKRILNPWILWGALLAGMLMGLISAIRNGNLHPPGFEEQIINADRLKRG